MHPFHGCVFLVASFCPLVCCCDCCLCAVACAPLRVRRCVCSVQCAVCSVQCAVLRIYYILNCSNQCTCCVGDGAREGRIIRLAHQCVLRRGEGVAYISACATFLASLILHADTPISFYRSFVVSTTNFPVPARGGQSPSAHFVLPMVSAFKLC